MSENITINERRNDGSKIHLYFNGFVGLYVAYGKSAFLLSKETEVSPSYSEDLQMPAVVINVAHYNLLKEKLEVVKRQDGYRCMKPDVAFEEKESSEWAQGRRGGVKMFGQTFLVQV